MIVYVGGIKICPKLYFVLKFHTWLHAFSKQSKDKSDNVKVFETPLNSLYLARIVEITDSRVEPSEKY